jgi:1,4-alpha-glucan branching enzyme
MLKRNRAASGHTKITFVLPQSIGNVSVVGDFNGWDPSAHPLRKRSNGTRSVTVDQAGGQAYSFRYYDGNGSYFDDPDADELEPNGFGETHSLLRV